MKLCGLRLRFLGKVLSVERASKVIEDTQHQESQRQTRKDVTSMVKDASVPKGSTDNYRGGYIHASEPVAEKLGVAYPFPPHLEYVVMSVILGPIIFVIFMSFLYFFLQILYELLFLIFELFLLCVHASNFWKLFGCLSGILAAVLSWIYISFICALCIYLLTSSSCQFLIQICIPTT